MVKNDHTKRHFGNYLVHSVMSSTLFSPKYALHQFSVFSTTIKITSRAVVYMEAFLRTVNIYKEMALNIILYNMCLL